MITATALELRAGPAPAARGGDLPDRPRRPGRPGRAQRCRQDHPHPGAGRRDASRPPARSPAPASVGYLPQDPRTGDLDVLARDRILSARGLDVVRTPAARRPRARWPAPTPTTHERAMRRYPRLEEEFQAAGGYAAETEAAAIASSLGLPERVLEQPLQHAVRRSAPAGRAGPASCSRRRPGRDAAARRADQPPRRRLHRLAARLPARRTRAGWWSSATTSSCSSTRSTGCSTWTPTGPSSTSTTSAGRPTCSSARPTSAGASGSAPTSRSRRPCCTARPTGCATRRPRQARRRAWTSGPTSSLAGLERGPPQPTRSPSCASRSRRRAARRR